MQWPEFLDHNPLKHALQEVLATLRHRPGGFSEQLPPRLARSSVVDPIADGRGGGAVGLWTNRSGWAS